MAGTEKERDWDKEMAEVDRLLNKLPHADPHLQGGSPPSGKRPRLSDTPTVPMGRVAGSGSGGQLSTWARVILGLLIGIGMTQWPYSHGCGLRLIFYLCGVLAVITAGLWSSVSSWRRRLGFAHILSQGLIIWGLVLAAREVLPRVGYAKVEGPWLCPDVGPK